MAVNITTREQAQTAATFLRDNPSHPQAQEIKDSLMAFANNPPPATPQEQAQAAAAAAPAEQQVPPQEQGTPPTISNEPTSTGLPSVFAGQQQVAEPAVQPRREGSNPAGLGTLFDLAFTFGTSALGTVASGTAGLFTAGLGAMFGGGPEQSLERAASVTKSGMEATAAVSSPRTQKGHDAMMSVAVPLMRFDEAAREYAAGATNGNPLAATAVYTAIVGAPDLIPVVGSWTRRARAGLSASRQQLNQLKTTADKLGLDLRGYAWQETIRENIDNIAPRAEDMGALQTRLREANTQSRARVDARYEQARKGDAWVKSNRLDDFLVDEIDTLQRRFDLENMPNLHRHINRLSVLEQRRTGPGTGSITNQPRRPGSAHINDLETMHQRINSEIPDNASTWTAEHKALAALRDDLDGFIRNEFNTRMIDGSPSAIRDWRQARAAATRHARNFKVDQTIRDLIKKEATPSDIRNWILGASQALPRSSAARVVNRLNRVLGVDSPEMVNLRAEFIHGLTEPLRRPNPSWNSFIKNLEQFRTRRAELIEPLGFDKSALNQLDKFIQAFQKHGADAAFSRYDPYTLLSRFTVGHSIARKAAKVSLFASVMRWGSTNVWGRGRSRIIKELAGGEINPEFAFIGRDSIAAAAFITAAELDQLGLDPDETEKYLRTATDAAVASQEQQQGEN